MEIQLHLYTLSMKIVSVSTQSITKTSEVKVVFNYNHAKLKK